MLGWLGDLIASAVEAIFGLIGWLLQLLLDSLLAWLDLLWSAVVAVVEYVVEAVWPYVKALFEDFADWLVLTFWEVVEFVQGQAEAVGLEVDPTLVTDAWAALGPLWDMCGYFVPTSELAVLTSSSIGLIAGIRILRHALGLVPWLNLG